LRCVCVDPCCCLAVSVTAAWAVSTPSVLLAAAPPVCCVSVVGHSSALLLSRASARAASAAVAAAAVSCSRPLLFACRVSASGASVVGYPFVVCRRGMSCPHLHRGHACHTQLVTHCIPGVTCVGGTRLQPLPLVGSHFGWMWSTDTRAGRPFPYLSLPCSSLSLLLLMHLMSSAAPLLLCLDPGPCFPSLLSRALLHLFLCHACPVSPLCFAHTACSYTSS
jgi:hypothetical protein